MEISNKLSLEEGLYVHNKALRAVEDGKDYYYRYGQAVFNILNAEFEYLANEIHMTDLDTFYKDEGVSTKILFGELTQEV